MSRSPIIIFGMAGSGTRLVTQIVNSFGYYTAHAENEGGWDCTEFTPVVGHDPNSAEAKRAIDRFMVRMDNVGDDSRNWAMKRVDVVPYMPLLVDRFTRNGSSWGSILVVRDPMDLIYPNVKPGGGVVKWGEWFGLEHLNTMPDTPLRDFYLSYWALTASLFSVNNPLVVRFEELIHNDMKTVDRIADYVIGDTLGFQDLATTFDLIERDRPKLGRWRGDLDPNKVIRGLAKQCRDRLVRSV